MSLAAQIRRLVPALILGLLLASAANLILTGRLPVAQRQMLEADVLDAESLALILKTRSGKVALVPLDASDDDLLRASVMHFGQLYFDVAGRAERSIRIEDRGGSTSLNFNSSADLDWRVRLNPAVPLSLDYTTQAAETSLDLRAFHLRALDVTSSTGPLRAYLPAPVTGYAVRWESSTALSELILPQGAAVELRLRAPLASSVQVEGLEQLGVDEEGASLWRSPAYDASEAAIIIDLASSGADVRVRFEPLSR